MNLQRKKTQRDCIYMQTTGWERACLQQVSTALWIVFLWMSVFLTPGVRVRFTTNPSQTLTAQDQSDSKSTCQHHIQMSPLMFLCGNPEWQLNLHITSNTAQTHDWSVEAWLTIYGFQRNSAVSKHINSFSIKYMSFTALACLKNTYGTTFSPLHVLLVPNKSSHSSPFNNGPGVLWTVPLTRIVVAAWHFTGGKLRLYGLWCHSSLHVPVGEGLNVCALTDWWSYLCNNVSRVLQTAQCFTLDNMCLAD